MDREARAFRHSHSLLTTTLQITNAINIFTFIYSRLALHSLGGVMVIKTQTCRYSGLRVYPGKGIVFIRSDGQQFLFLSHKIRSYFHQRLRPQKIAWTTAYRKAHKKDQTAHIVRKRKTVQRKPAVRSIAGASLEIIQKKRNEQPEVRKASREAALREVKERMKKKQGASYSKGGQTAKGQASKYGKGTSKPMARTGARK